MTLESELDGTNHAVDAIRYAAVESSCVVGCGCDNNAEDQAFIESYNDRETLHKALLELTQPKKLTFFEKIKKYFKGE